MFDRGAKVESPLLCLGLKKILKMGCTNSIELTDEHYYAAVEHDTISEKIVELGEKKHKRHVACWMPVSNEPKGIVVVSHGLHEHALRYYSLAHALTEKNYVVYAIDHCGHGRSAPTKSEKGYIEDYKILVEDFVAFVAHARSENKEGLPLYVIAHSMGTLVANLAIKDIPNVAAVVFSGIATHAGPAGASPFGCRCLYPVFQGPRGVSVARFMARIAPRAPAAPIDPKSITSDPQQMDILMRDPHRYPGEVMNKTGFEVLKMIEEVKENVHTNVSVPFLALHGEDDELTYPEGTYFVHKNAGTPDEHKRMEILKGQRHEIFHESKQTMQHEDGSDIEHIEGITKAVAYIEDRFANFKHLDLSKVKVEIETKREVLNIDTN